MKPHHAGGFTVCVNWIFVGCKGQKAVFAVGLGGLRQETDAGHLAHFLLCTCCFSAVVREQANVRRPRGFHLRKEPETNKTALTTFDLVSKKSPRLGVMFLVTLRTLGRVVTRPWEGFPRLLWPLSALCWGSDVG